jgi:hypothetical protein
VFVVDEVTQGEEDGNAYHADCAPSGNPCQIGDCTASVLEAIISELTKPQEFVCPVDRKTGFPTVHVLFGEVLDETRRMSGAVSMILLVVLLVQRPDHGVICLLVL